VDSRFLPFVFQTEAFITFATNRKIGSTNPHVRWRDIAEFQFALPPLDLQRCIAEILWDVDKTLQNYQSTLAASRTALRSQCENCFSNNGKSKWPTVSMEDICTIQQGQVDPKQDPYSQMIHLAPDDIESDTGRILEKKTAAEDKVISGKYEFTDEAVLYCKIRPYLRKVAFPRFSGICSADMYPLYPKLNTLPEFLFRLLLSEDFTKFAIMHSARSAFPKLNRESLFAYRLRLPPLDEQRTFLVQVNKIAGVIEQLADHIEHLRHIGETLTNSIFA
jgi:type I restriction enzyme, S subunit